MPGRKPSGARCFRGTWGFWVSLADRERFVEAMRASGQVAGFEATLRRKDGTDLHRASSPSFGGGDRRRHPATSPSPGTSPSASGPRRPCGRAPSAWSWRPGPAAWAIWDRNLKDDSLVWNDPTPTRILRPGPAGPSTPPTPPGGNGGPARGPPRPAGAAGRGLRQPRPAPDGVPDPDPVRGRGPPPRVPTAWSSGTKGGTARADDRRPAGPHRAGAEQRRSTGRCWRNASTRRSWRAWAAWPGDRPRHEQRPDRRSGHRLGTAAAGVLGGADEPAGTWRPSCTPPAGAGTWCSALTDFARKGLTEPPPIDFNETVRREVDLTHATLEKVQVELDLDLGLAPALGDPSALGAAS